MRDAIVLSGWTWEARNVPERCALALSHLGARVLYSENPVSFLRGLRAPVREVHKGIFSLRPSFFGHRFNLNAALSRLQGKRLVSQIIGTAERLRLNNPVIFYPHGLYCLTVARELRKRNLSMVHICMDYPLEDQLEHVGLSDVTLTIPDAAYDELRIEFGHKIRQFPQFGSAVNSAPRPTEKQEEPTDLSAIPHPRLLYLGNVQGRIDLDMLRKLLLAHPEWQFISFGIEKSIYLPNAHVLAWRPVESLEAVVDHVDLGFLPYDCADAKNLHCVPLKLFDYFSRGMPVVSTPLLYVEKHRDLVYVGATAEELASAVVLALAEPRDGTMKQMRRKVGLDHSIAKVAVLLEPLLQVRSDGTFNTAAIG